jgi:hypothetical protein
VTDSRDFVRSLGADNAAWWTGRDVRLDPAAPPVELIAAWIPHVPEKEDPDDFPPRPECRILPDEYRHAAIGRRALTPLCDTPERQAAARAACREVNERVFGAYRAHRARVDRRA